MMNNNELIQLDIFELNYAIIEAIKIGDINAVKYMLNSPELDERVDINVGSDKILMQACQSGKLEIVDYILSSPELEKHSNIKNNNNEALVLACEFGHLEIVKYLLTSNKIKLHTNMYAQYGQCFISACENNHLDVVKFLIFDMNIDKTKNLETYLINFKKDEIINLFVLRELNNNLNISLDTNLKNKSKVKI